MRLKANRNMMDFLPSMNLASRSWDKASAVASMVLVLCTMREMMVSNSSLKLFPINLPRRTEYAISKT